MQHLGYDSNYQCRCSSGLSSWSLLFLVFINDLTKNIGTNIHLFADDTTLFVDFNDEVEAANNINSDPRLP